MQERKAWEQDSKTGVRALYLGRGRRCDRWYDKWCERAVGHQDYKDNAVIRDMSQIWGGLLDSQSEALNAALQCLFSIPTRPPVQFATTHGTALINSALFKAPLSLVLSRSADVLGFTALPLINIRVAFQAEVGQFPLGSLAGHPRLWSMPPLQVFQSIWCSPPLSYYPVMVFSLTFPS